MSILTKQAILREIEAGNIVITPFSPELANPNSVDLRLADKLLVYIDPWLDVRNLNETKEVLIPPEGLRLYPGILYLASTVEYTETHGFVPCIEGKSSMGRLGIDVHKTAGFGDTGFKGKFCLEISVVHPVRVFAGMKICQIIYHTIEGEPTEYSGKYQNQDKPIASRSWMDFKK